MTKRQTEIPAEQRNSDYEIGYGRPPRQHQWQPGQSGNPGGPPTHRCNLWLYFCDYMNQTDKELADLDRTHLSQSQQAALKLVESTKDGNSCGAERLARYVADRELGRPTELHVVETANPWQQYKAWRDGLAEQGRKSIEAKVQGSESDVA